MDALAVPGLRPDAARTRRVMVAAAVKSGSTYVANVLSRYLESDAGNGDLSVYWPAEQNLSRELLASLGDRSYVLQFHLRPYPPNLRLCAEYGLALLVQWRNLGDVITSFDDHVRTFGELQPVCYIHDRATYFALGDQERYAFLIRNALPWYLGFYLSWRRLHASLGVYERMVADPASFFREALARIGVQVDERRLARAIPVQAATDRLNVGQVGRSAERFSEATKRLLERTVLEYVPSGQLEILLWELPWAVPALRRASEHDGALVTAERDERVYFVSRGVRRRVVSPSWIESRWALRDEPIRTVRPAELGALPQSGILD